MLHVLVTYIRPMPIALNHQTNQPCELLRGNISLYFQMWKVRLEEATLLVPRHTLH